MTVLTQKSLDELLEYLEKSISNISKDMMDNSVFNSDFQDLENFISSQFDIRLENLLHAKHSSIHHLESGMKNRIIQKKKILLDRIKSQLNT